MKKKEVIGIDPGTTFSEVSHITDSGAVEVIPNLDGDLKTPSIVSWASGKPVEGKAALPDLVLAPEYVARCSKRYMCRATNDQRPIPILHDPSGNELTPVDPAAAILGFLKKSAEDYLGSEVEDAVITVPAYFDENGRNNTIAAAKIAGFRKVQLLNEPESAAIYYGLEKGRNETMVVVDSGGGTTDVNAIEIKDGKIKGLVTDGDSELGGSNYTEGMFEFVCQEGRANGIEISAEKDLATFNENLDRTRDAKEMLSRREDVMLIPEAEGKRFPIKFSRKMLRQTCRPYDERFINCCRRLFNELQTKGKTPDRVLLVGGNSRLFHVPEMVKEVFGLEPSRDGDPDLIVCKGAAIWAQVCFGKKDEQINIDGHRYLTSEIKIQTVAAHAICVAARKNRTDPDEYNWVIVHANIPLPHPFEESFAPVNPGASEVVVKIVQGKEGQPSKNSPVLREIRVPVEPSNTDEDRIKLKGRYTEEGLVEMTVVDVLLGKPISDSFIHKAGLTQAEIDEKRQQLMKDMGDDNENEDE